MKMIKIILRNGSEYVIDQFKFDKLELSQSQMINLTGYNGEKLYKGFNKADIIEFYVDDSETKKMERHIKGVENLIGKEIPEDCPQSTLDAIEVYKYYKQQTKSLTI